MARRDPFRAEGGVGQDGMRRRRQNWPGFAPAIQPGSTRLPTEPDRGDAREVVIPPPNGQPFDHRNFDHHALATMLGIQGALSSGHIRALLQDLLDSMLRATFKPVTAPPWIQKPFVAMDFGGVASMTVPAGGAWTTITDGTTTLSFTMPDGRMGVLTEFAQGAVSPTDWDSLCWRVTLNGTPLFPWNNVCCQVSSLPSPRKVQIIVPPGSTVRLQVANSSGGDITLVTGMLVGWHWPVAVAGDVMNAHGQASIA